jgi:tRNA dimethylallyltransferase
MTAVLGRVSPAATARCASLSAGECGAKDQVSHLGSSLRPVHHLALVGPTATGKTALAVALARRRGDLELVSADAMAVYRGLDIGTAKPSPAEREGVRWHLLDLIEPTETFSVAQFQRVAREAIAEIEERGHRAVLVGGTGLYHRAVLDDLELPGRYPALARALEAAACAPGGPQRLHRRLAALDPIAAGRIEPTNARRIVRALEVTLGSGRPFSSYGPGLEHYGATRFVIVGLRLERAELFRRITDRLDCQLAGGFLDEVKAWHESGPVSRTAGKALGYEDLLCVLQGKASLDEARRRLVVRTRAFARRQEAWFRRDPRVHWLDAAEPGLVSLLEAHLGAVGFPPACVLGAGGGSAVGG